MEKSLRLQKLKDALVKTGVAEVSAEKQQASETFREAGQAGDYEKPYLPDVYLQDANNLSLINANKTIDDINAEFYSQITYPYPPQYFEKLDDPRFWADMLDQDLGTGSDPVLPPTGGKIWVAGCGTNQALITALKFPHCQVIGSDLSVGSLKVCERNQRQLGVENLTLRNESITGATYQDQFDFVICTGVIHHNPEPAIPLARLMEALKPDGVMEVMVYNRFRRLLNTSFTKALRILTDTNQSYNYEMELALARSLLKNLNMPNTMKTFLDRWHDSPFAEFADELIQPLEYSYTVESFHKLAGVCRLEILTPVIDQFGRSLNTYKWNMEFADKDLQDQYLSLPDLSRWQISNLLMQELSPPYIWFYLQRQSSTRKRKSEKELCQQFLESRFSWVKGGKTLFILDQHGKYEKSDQVLKFPGRPSDDLAKKVFLALNKNKPIRETFRQLNIPLDFTTVNHLRMNLATSGFPYIKYV